MKVLICLQRLHLICTLPLPFANNFWQEEQRISRYGILHLLRFCYNAVASRSKAALKSMQAHLLGWRGGARNTTASPSLLLL